MISQYKQQFAALVSCILLMCACVTTLQALNYDANKFSNIVLQRYGQDAYKDALELNQIMAKIRPASDAEKLKAINDFFNQKIQFGDDIDIWKQSDYWATPSETLGIHAGDCEDFSIAKYMFLLRANMDNDKLRMTYVRANLSGDGNKIVRAHMVVSYYRTPQSEPLILDNLEPDILPASQRKDLFPIFSFNKQGIWVGSSDKPKGESQAHLSRWRDLLSRIRADGIEY